jgi:hypothetical protein
LAVALQRYMVGADAAFTLTATTGWQPPLPALVLLGALAAAQAALVVWLWARTRTRAATERTVAEAELSGAHR